MYSTGYPKGKIHFVRGRVEETIPTSTPDSISLLRLDTDWYESTRHELIHLFPRLSRSGVIIVDATVIGKALGKPVMNTLQVMKSQFCSTGSITRAELG